MEEGFELLEQRVQKAALRLRELQEANDALRSELQSAKARAEKAEREARVVAERASAAEGSEAAARELAGLRREREEIRSRVLRLVELLGRLE